MSTKSTIETEQFEMVTRSKPFPWHRWVSVNVTKNKRNGKPYLIWIRMMVVNYTNTEQVGETKGGSMRTRRMEKYIETSILLILQKNSYIYRKPKWYKYYLKMALTVFVIEYMETSQSTLFEKNLIWKQENGIFHDALYIEWRCKIQVHGYD